MSCIWICFVIMYLLSYVSMFLIMFFFLFDIICGGKVNIFLISSSKNVLFLVRQYWFLFNHQIWRKSSSFYIAVYIHSKHSCIYTISQICTFLVSLTLICRVLVEILSCSLFVFKPFCCAIACFIFHYYCLMLSSVSACSDSEVNFT